jgi:hypothetical protein
LFGEFETMQAKIVRPALQQGYAHGASQRPGDRRQVARKQLILERACTRRNDDSHAGHERGDQVRKRLASAGARLDDKPSAASERLLNRCRHTNLLVARRKAGNCARERAVGAEQFLPIPTSVH